MVGDHSQARSKGKARQPRLTKEHGKGYARPGDSWKQKVGVLGSERKKKNRKRNERDKTKKIVYLTQVQEGRRSRENHRSPCHAKKLNQPRDSPEGGNQLRAKEKGGRLRILGNLGLVTVKSKGKSRNSFAH